MASESMFYAAYYEKRCFSNKLLIAFRRRNMYFCFKS